MAIKWFMLPFSCVILPLPQPQVANQQQKNIIQLNLLRVNPFAGQNTQLAGLMSSALHVQRKKIFSM